MKRIVPSRERLSSAWLNGPRRGSTESNTLYTSQRYLPLPLNGRSRSISSQSTFRAQHWENPLSSTRPESSQYGQNRISISDHNKHATPRWTPQTSTNGELAVPRMDYEYHEDPGESGPLFSSPREEQEYAARFYRIIEEGQPDCLMTAMTDPRSAGLVGSLPQTTFLEALHRLSPIHFVDPFRTLHHPLHSWSILLDGLKRAEEHFDDFVANLLTIVEFRTTVQPLQLAEYTHLLDCARSMGNAPFAHQIWEAMRKRGVARNTICYNHYMEALIWDHCYTGKEAYRLRMLPRNYRKRRLGGPNRSVGWRGYGTGKPLSVRHTILELLDTMLREGHLPDERTYINVLVAGARVGHKPGMRLILKTVWNIDIDAMKIQSVPDDAKLQPLTPYDPWSALHPTEDLLFAVAHSLGTNNNIPGAIRVIQLISSTYNIPITEKVWLELFERAYVLCRARTSEYHAERDNMSNTLGVVPLELVQSIFDVMTSAPYNVTPTLQVWRFMLNISIRKGNLDESKNILRNAYKLLQETRKKQTEARQVVLRCLKPALDVAEAQVLAGASAPDPELFSTPELADAIQSYDLIRLEVYQQAYLLRRCCWSVILNNRWEDTSNEAWLLQERPKIMEEWKDFLPESKRLVQGDDIGSFAMEGLTTIHSRHWFPDSTRIPVRRLAHGHRLFFPVEPRRLTEQRIWEQFLERYHPFLDTESANLSKLFKFETPMSPKLQEDVHKLRSTWTEYPEESPLASRPHAGLYGRLAALGMVRTEERGVYYLSEGSWV